ncbi:OmpA family protein [Stenotrophomonas maltophilia]|uniref:OmpA family protein n=1 Tax=Stenotrophomonas maltophilia TaxID=40324 RepID=UPI0013DB4564|nr:OmpA family protein [Stenotrophomonas maltophilia]
MNAATIAKLALPATLFLGLAACSSTAVKHTDGEVSFPSTDRIILKEGTFPNVANLRAIGPGVTKEQLYDLIGRPHFSEGFSPKAWNYLFHFRTAEGIVTCQYQVVFDKDKRGQSFHWAPAACADQLAQAVDDQPAVKRFSLSADALFAFGRSGVADIRPGGREELARVAAELAAAKDVRISVVGHTDRIGSDADNLALSQARATTVRQFLIDQALPAASITASGRGEAEPVTRGCSDGLKRADLVACLAPDRRVEIAIHAQQ